MFEPLDDMGFAPEYATTFGLHAEVGEASFSFRHTAGEARGASILMHVCDDTGFRWVGDFTAGNGGLDLACCGPTQAHLTVVVQGVAYVVPVRHPSQFQVVALRPVLGVRRVPERDILVLFGFSDVVAHAPGGQLWSAEAVALDGLRLDSLNDTVINGVALGKDGDPDEPFQIDVLTGRVRGGYLAKMLEGSHQAAIDDEEPRIGQS